MYDNYNYPAGADTPDAPWNQIDLQEIEVKCDVMVSVVREGVPVMTDNYTRDDDGIEVFEEHLTDDYENGHHAHHNQPHPRPAGTALRRLCGRQVQGDV